MTHGRRPVIPLLLVLAIGIFAVAVQSARLRAAENEAATALAALTASEADLRELLRLRSEDAVVSSGVTPSHTVLAKINGALAAAGLPQQLATDILPEAVVDDRDEGRGVRRRQAIRLTLSSVRPTDVGAFLAAWQDREPLWSITRIDLLHATGRGAREQGRYDATIGLQTTYVSFD